MMSQVLVFLSLLALSFQALNTQKSDIQPDGTFEWSYQSDAATQEQRGTPKKIDAETPVVIQGSASWTDKEGGKHEIKYVADENGYQPKGDDVPKVPPQILRALEYIAAHPEPANRKSQL